MVQNLSDNLSSVLSGTSLLLMPLFCRMFKSRTGDQILNGTEQNHDYFVDNLFEEAQKIGAICMSPTTVKNQVGVDEKNASLT